MGANRFMSPVQTQYQQTYIDQHVPLPFEILQKAADNRQKVYDTNAQQAEIAKSWLDVKHREYDKVGYDRIKQSYEGQIADAVEGAGGDYSVIGPKIRAIAATIKSDMNDGELSVIANNYNSYQADLAHKKKLEDEGNLSGLNSMNMMYVSDQAHKNSVDAKTGIGRYSAYHHALDVDPNKELAAQLAHMKESSYQAFGGALQPLKAGETTYHADTKTGRSAITAAQIKKVVEPYLQSNPKVKAYLERNVRALYGEKAYEEALANILTGAQNTFAHENNTIDRTLHRDAVGDENARYEREHPPVVTPATEMAGNVNGMYVDKGVPGKNYSRDNNDIAFSGTKLANETIAGLLKDLKPGQPYNKKVTDTFLLGAMVRQGIIKQGTKLSEVNPAQYNQLMAKIADGSVNLKGLVGENNGAKAKSIRELFQNESNRVQELRDKRDEAINHIKEQGGLPPGQAKTVGDYPKRREDLRHTLDTLPGYTEAQKDEMYDMLVNGHNLKQHESTHAYNGVQSGKGYGKVADLPAVKSFLAYKDQYEKVLNRSDVTQKLEDFYDARNEYKATVGMPTMGGYSLDNGTKPGIKDGDGTLRKSFVGKELELYNKMVTTSKGKEMSMKDIIDKRIIGQRAYGAEKDPITQEEIRKEVAAMNANGGLMGMKTNDGKNLWKMSNADGDYYLRLDVGPNAKADTRTYGFKGVSLHPEATNKIAINTALHKALTNGLERSYIGPHTNGVAIHARKPEEGDDTANFTGAAEDGSNYNISIDPRKYGVKNGGNMIMIPEGKEQEFLQAYQYAKDHLTEAETKELVRSYILHKNTN